MNATLRDEFVRTHHELLKNRIREYCTDDIMGHLEDISDVDDAISMIMSIMTITCAHDVSAHDALNVLIHDTRRDINNPREF